MVLLKIKSWFMIVLLVMSIFSVYLIGEVDLVSASHIGGNSCCERTLGGSFCVYTDTAQCDPSYASSPSSCDQTSFCQPVCCVDAQNGQCYPNVGAAQCANKVGTTVDVTDSLCQSNPVCQQGCCQVGNQCFLSTQNSCLYQVNNYPNIIPDWNNGITDEYACVDQCAQQDEGCCVDATSCLWTTKGQCSSNNFKSGVYCSDNSLSCGCTPRYRKGCLSDEEDVFWFDSCGNAEGVAEDCDYALGTLCASDGNDAVCGSVHCEDTKLYVNEQGENMNPWDPRAGGFRGNGESWCVYESGTGGFYDRPGSRHYRHVCVNGQELVEPCKDFREEICVQGDVAVEGTPLSFASCKNLDEFPKIDMEKYQQTNDIGRSTIMPGTPDFTDPEKTLISSTTVDKGSRFWEGENAEACEVGKVQCKVIYARSSHFSDYKCEANCDCEKPEFIEKAANYCKMFGDCGADVNILGRGTDDGLPVRWRGTSEGPHPRDLPQGSYASWDVYGRFDGMDALSTTLSGDISDRLAEMSEIGVQLAALAQIAYLVYTAVPILLTGGTLSVGFISAFMETLFGGLIAAGPLGWIIVVILLVLIIIFGDVIGELIGSLLGSDTKSKTITVSCEPWVAPLGGADCDKCGLDGRECSEYRCKSLGTGCELINEGTSNQGCVLRSPQDVSPPLINPWPEALSDGYTIQQTGTGYLVQPDIGYWESFTFGIQTDEEAQCKWDDIHTNTYQEMPHFFESSLFTKQKNMTVSLPGGSDYTYYVRCVDANGNENVNEYTIQFSTVKEPDLTPPLIVSTSIVSGAYMPHDVTESHVALQLNEPVELCWWDLTNGAELEDVPVEQTFVCGNSPGSQGFENPSDPDSWSYSCDGLLTGIGQGAGVSTTYFLRCDDLAGNRMAQAYQLALQGSSPLKLVSAEPSVALYTNNITLFITTAEGAQQGASICSYKEEHSPVYIEFFTTGGTTHQQLLSSLFTGTYYYDISCVDVAGNNALGIVEFSVAVDTVPPHVTQIYTVGSTLHVVTNELSTCAYHTIDSQFSFDAGKVFGVAILDHVITEESPVYYVQCQDDFDNLLSGVTIYV
jgi:hypothetical protein